MKQRNGGERVCDYCGSIMGPEKRSGYNRAVSRAVLVGILIGVSFMTAGISVLLYLLET
jgi:hypothetical protein